MKILHVIPSMDPRSGGPARAVVTFANLTSSFADVTIASTTEGFNNMALTHIREKISLNKDVKLLLFNYIGSHSYKYSWKLSYWLGRHISRFDKVHLHAAFSIMTSISARICREHGISYIFRPLGTLSEYSMQEGIVWAKKIYFHAFEKQTLKGAEAVHVTSNAEKKQLLNLCDSEKKIYMIPIPEQLQWPAPRKRAGEVLKLGFLSRIHPKKNLETLFEVIAHTDIPVHLSIAGTGEPSYIKKLKKLTGHLNIAENITWLGFINDGQKKDFFNQIDYMILPSWHENFGIAVIESLSYRRPVILSRNVDTAVWVLRYKCGLVTDSSSASIKKALIKASQMSEDEYRAMSKAAGILVENELSLPVVRQKLKAMYGS